MESPVKTYYCGDEQMELDPRGAGPWVRKEDYDALVLSFSNTQSRWIPMGERLPTPGIYVLVTMQERPNFVSTSALVARGEGGCAWSNGADWTHWMPLPEAPKC